MEKLHDSLMPFLTSVPLTREEDNFGSVNCPAKNREQYFLNYWLFNSLKFRVTSGFLARVFSFGFCDLASHTAIHPQFMKIARFFHHVNELQ